MVVLAEGWSDPAVVVAVGALAVAIVFGIIAAVVTRRASFPKRSLTCTMLKPTRLFIEPNGFPSGNLEVTYNGDILRDPHLVKIQLRNTGRRDIPGALFDGGASIKMAMTSRIVEILDTSREGPSHAGVSAVADESSLMVAPTLIPRKLTTTFSLLTDGEPSLEVHAQLIDVNIRIRSWRDSEDRVVLNATRLAVGGTVLAGIASVSSLISAFAR